MSCPPSSIDHAFPDEALYRKFFNDSVDEMYLHDENGVLLDVNEASSNNLGYRREELIGMTVADISAEYSTEALLALWKNHAIGQHTYTANCHRRKDGSTYQLEVHINCQETNGKKVFLVAARRNEEKRERENEILQLNKRLRSLVDQRTRQWQESSRLLNAVMEQTPDSIFIKDIQGRYQYVNHAFAHQLELSVAEILGRTDFDIYPTEQAQDFATVDQQVLQSQAPRVYEARMQTGAGTVYANTMKSPYRDEDGGVVGILGITRNVSEIRQAQELMKHNYEMLRQAERIAKIGSWTLNLTTNTFTASEMLAEMNGLTPDDPPLTPETLGAMIPEDQHTTLSAAIAQCIQKGVAYTVDVEHKHPHGGTFPARIRGQAYRDASGKIVMLHGTLQDLSEHVEADQRLQTLADNLPNGAIFRCEQTEDGKMLLRYVSAGIQRMLGISSSTFLTQQKTFTSHIYEEDKPGFFSAVQSCMQSSTPFDLVCRILNGDGRLRWVRTRAVPRRTHQGMLWEGILLDITTEYETQERLRLAKEAAEVGERAKSDFLATMSHEIRTPMNTVIGMTQLLQQTPMSPKQRNYLDKVALSANALLKIINEILDFSKLEAEMLNIAPVPFELDELLEAVVAVTGLQAERKGIEIIYDIAPSVPRHLRGDLQRLSQVLTNLVGNAIKFTDRGEVVISMHAETDQEQPLEHCLHVSVRDTGIGIHPDHMAQLFKPFTQAEAHISRRFGGTGLGLAICHKLVQLMGGEINVKSTPGEGSSFSFYVHLQAQPHTSTPKSFVDADCRVLVVDDNFMARETLASMVQDFGLHCDTASDGEQALELLHRANHSGQPYHLVLMDWQMPGMDGLEVAQCIRADASLSTTPAMLMVTAYCRDEVMDRVTALELQGLLIKPVTESVLFNAMQEALHLQHAIQGLHIRHLPSHQHLQTPESLQGRKVLVVDDNALNREVAQDFLELAGVQVTTASSGKEALQLLHQRSFDAVLLDVQMPEMDGLEVARRIRRQEQWSQLPVWALTAQTREEDRDAIIASGMNGQLTKPINAQLLYQTLAQVFAALPPATTNGTSSPIKLAASEVGIARHFGGQQDRMQRLLRAFVRDFASAPEQLLTLHQAQDFSALGMLAHTLKGSLGYLDQPAAMQAMESLEWACKQHQVSATLVQSASNYLQQVLKHIQQNLIVDEEETSPTPASQIDCQALIAQIDLAIPAIRRGEYAGIRALESVETQLRGTALHGMAARSLALTEDLETQAACDCLQSLRQALQPSAQQF